jgi:hypothetical protein
MHLMKVLIDGSTIELLDNIGSYPYSKSTLAVFCKQCMRADQLGR